MRLVLDTDVIIAAMRSPEGGSAALLNLIDQGFGTILLSVPFILEYEAICHLPEHRLASGLNGKEIDVFISTLVDMAYPVDIHYHWKPQLRDPGDEMVLETAINGRADALVTFNHKDYGDIPARFGIELMLPREALVRIRT